MKALLTLLLMTMQLLTGSGASVYLCIGCDGSYGIETSPDSCLCEDEGHVDKFACDCGDEHCGHRQSDSHAEPLDDTSSSHAPCGCTHVPLLVSSSQQMDFVRSLNTPHTDDSSLPAILPLDACFQEEFIESSDSLWYVLGADVPNFTLAVIATVVLRC